MVCLSEDSWYGRSYAAGYMSRTLVSRAIETRRALIRATNTGISALVDPLGRIVARTGQWRAEVLVGRVPVIEGGASTVYMRTGDLVGWLAWTGVLVGLVADRRARRPVVPRAPAPRRRR